MYTMPLQVFIKYVKRRLYRYVLYTRSPDLQKALHAIVRAHNDTPLRALYQMTPNEVFHSADKEFELFERRFPHFKYGGTPARAPLDGKIHKIGSFVRVLEKRSPLGKEIGVHSNRWSDAVYQVRTLIRTRCVNT